MGSVGHFPVTGRKMRPVTDEIPTELCEITARDYGIILIKANYSWPQIAVWQKPAGNVVETPEEDLLPRLFWITPAELCFEVYIMTLILGRNALIVVGNKVTADWAQGFGQIIRGLLKRLFLTVLFCYHGDMSNWFMTWNTLAMTYNWFIMFDLINRLWYTYILLFDNVIYYVLFT